MEKLISNCFQSKSKEEIFQLLYGDASLEFQSKIREAKKILNLLNSKNIGCCCLFRRNMKFNYIRISYNNNAISDVDVIKLIRADNNINIDVVIRLGVDTKSNGKYFICAI